MEETKKTSKPLDRIFTWLYRLFFVAVFMVVLLLLGSKLPIPGNFRVLIVQSGSMEPAIPTGAVVIVRPAAEYAIGDIITFARGRRQDTPVTHRIVEIKGEGALARYVTKGDANDAADLSEVERGEVLGRALFHLPWAGYAVAAVRKPMGFALIVVLPAILVIIDEALSIKREWAKRRARITNNPASAEASAGKQDTISK